MFLIAGEKPWSYLVAGIPDEIRVVRITSDLIKKDLFNFRFQKINSQVTNPSQIGITKKTIARLKTILKEKINA